MAYSGETDNYGIPYMKRGDYIVESEEERRARIIDNLLYAANFGASKAIVQDAQYTLVQYADHCTLEMESAGGDDVVVAILNKRLARKTEGASFDIAKGTERYIYLVYSEGMEANPALATYEMEDMEIGGHVRQRSHKEETVHRSRIDTDPELRIQVLGAR